MNIIVTGASGNLGKATTEKFLSEGHNVFATVSPKGLGYETKRNVNTYVADLSKEESVNSTISKITADAGSIDAAVLTVGGFAMGNIASTDHASLQKMMAINFDTAYLVVRPLLQHMLAQKKGRIVLIGSRPGMSPKDGKGVAAYALSKSLIFHLAEILNAEGNASNVYASVVVPGTIDTPINRAAMPKADFNTWQKPEFIANVIAELVKNDGTAAQKPVVVL